MAAAREAADMRVSYSVFCGGRVLRVTEQLNVSIMATAEAVFVGGRHWWIIDEQRVEEDVAQAMIAAYAG